MLDILDKYKDLYIVDLGHHLGHFVGDFIRKIEPLNVPVYVLAIDPIDYNTGLNNKFIQAAISTKTGKRKFYTYSEPGCNSLNEMLLDNKFQRPQPIEKTGEIEVPCVTLASILDHLKPDMIHMLKVDAQGNDLDCIKSAENWLDKCLFVQMETCVAKTADTLMYKNQNTRDSDVEYMLSRGFELFDEWDHSDVSCPEADLIFFNRKLYEGTY